MMFRKFITAFRSANRDVFRTFYDICDETFFEKIFNKFKPLPIFEESASREYV